MGSKSGRYFTLVHSNRWNWYTRQDNAANLCAEYLGQQTDERTYDFLSAKAAKS